MYPPRAYTGGNPNFQEMPRQQPTNPSGGADGMRVPQLPSIPGGMAGGMTGMPPWNNHQHQMPGGQYPPGSGFGASGRPNTGETWGGHPGTSPQAPSQGATPIGVDGGLNLSPSGNAMPGAPQYRAPSAWNSAAGYNGPPPTYAANPPIQGQTPTNPANNMQLPPWAAGHKNWQWGQQGFASPGVGFTGTPSGPPPDGGGDG